MYQLNMNWTNKYQFISDNDIEPFIKHIMWYVNCISFENKRLKTQIVIFSLHTRVLRLVPNSHILVGVVFNVLVLLSNIRFHICCAQWNSYLYLIIEGCRNVSHLLTRYYYSCYLTPLSTEYFLAYKKLNKGRYLRGVLIFPAV